MAAYGTQPTTGLIGLDAILKGLIAGDNIVWQVDSIEDYKRLVIPFCEAARDAGHQLTYFRFASHEQLIPDDFGADIHHLSPEDGFENFIAAIHAVIEDAGYGAYYVFDCLSELAGDWYSDQMLGNFFMLTCPYLYDLETYTYFALYRDSHSYRAIGPITETTQLLLEVLRHRRRMYVRPIKVLHRYSPTMHMLHSWEDDDSFKPVTASAVIADIQSSVPWRGLGPNRTPGFWQRAFMDAEEALRQLEAGRLPPEAEGENFAKLVRMIITRDEGMLSLAREYLSLRDLLQIGGRMIGTGLVGGKTVGMLLARAILVKASPELAALLEPHDSFYIGSDVFYTFLVQNGVWWIRQNQRNPETFLRNAEQARHRILTGKFPEYIVRQLSDMLDYFGQSPFIVRSSSLLEDNFGNSFAGKYESVFCANQGPKERRLEDFLSAIRTIYASTMSEKALSYRARRDMLERDEQMALLVMRVSGAMHGRYFMPDIAGVGFSFNPYVWNENIDPNAGVIRLVFGLGTRAVDRSDDDYTRVVALNAPERRPESNFDEVKQYSQRRVDYLDLEANQLVSGRFPDLVAQCENIQVDMFVSGEKTGTPTPGAGALALTFDGLLTQTRFVEDMREVLSLLQKAYNHPVDTEFTANFLGDGSYRLNLVQCRPLQAKGSPEQAVPKVTAEKDNCIVLAKGAVIGHSRVINIDNLVYVRPEKYGALPLRERHSVANIIGKLNAVLRSTPAAVNLLMGPGRWGTSTPSLGIPVSFSQINHMSVLCEIVTMREDLIPDVSLGTHFLNELVEMDMLYIALFPEHGGNYMNADFFESAPNSLEEILPDAARWTDTVKVIQAGVLDSEQAAIVLHADAHEQRVACYFAQS